MQSDRPQVLVVEDHPDIGALYERLMPGCRVFNVTSGAAALQALDGGKFDLIILDMHLGSLRSVSGLDVLRHVRCQQNEHANMSTPVIAISADDRLRSEARASGASFWISKPIDIDEFYRYLNLLKI